MAGAAPRGRKKRWNRRTGGSNNSLPANKPKARNMSNHAKSGGWKAAPARNGSGSFTATALLIPAVSLLLMLSACSTVPSGPPTLELPANLAQKCPDLPQRPEPFLDPARELWELAIIALYGECGERHIRSINARP